MIKIPQFKSFENVNYDEINDEINDTSYNYEELSRDANILKETFQDVNILTARSDEQFHYIDNTIDRTLSNVNNGTHNIIKASLHNKKSLIIKSIIATTIAGVAIGGPVGAGVAAGIGASVGIITGGAIIIGSVVGALAGGTGALGTTCAVHTIKNKIDRARDQEIL